MKRKGRVKKGRWFKEISSLSERSEPKDKYACGKLKRGLPTAILRKIIFPVELSNIFTHHSFGAADIGFADHAYRIHHVFVSGFAPAC